MRKCLVSLRGMHVDYNSASSCPACQENARNDEELAHLSLLKDLSAHGSLLALNT